MQEYFLSESVSLSNNSIKDKNERKGKHCGVGEMAQQVKALDSQESTLNLRSR